jgi:hypothetical protein
LVASFYSIYLLVFSLLNSIKRRVRTSEAWSLKIWHGWIFKD